MKRTVVLSLTLAATAAGAQQQSIKPRPLGAVQATSKELLGLPTVVRSLSDGSAIVNDVARRRLLKFDASLSNYSVVADSTSGSVNGYGPRSGALIPYVADSSLFLDPTAGSFLVIDPAGKVTRVMSPPRPNDNGAIASTVGGFAGFDSKGRMVYRTSYRSQMQQLRDGSIQMAPPVDSAPLLRVDLDTRRADTVGHLKLARMIPSTMTMPNGGTMTMQRSAPLAAIDDWAVLSDGTIAIVRGGDYHIDFIKPDGSKSATGKMAFDWKRLTDEDKFAIIDSISKAAAAGPAAGGPTFIGGGVGERIMIGGGRGGGGDAMVTREMVAGMAAGMAAASSAPPPSAASSSTGSSGAASSSTGSSSSSTSSSGSASSGSGAASSSSTTNGATPSNAAPAAAAQSGAPTGFTMPALPAPAISELPDYMPAFTQASARADADANLWIRTTTPGAQPGNVVYDVISSQGALVDRVDVPKGMQIVGFGKGGIVYLSQREGYGYRILKASIH